jgi:hypothetical protein
MRWIIYRRVINERRAENGKPPRIFLNCSSKVDDAERFPFKAMNPSPASVEVPHILKLRFQINFLNFELLIANEN